MFKEKIISGSIIECAHNNVDKLIQKNKLIVEAEAHLESMFKYGLTDEYQLEDSIHCLISQAGEVYYYQGLQDGAKVINTLLSGNLPSEIMETWNVYCEAPEILRNNINNHYKRIKEGERAHG